MSKELEINYDKDADTLTVEGTTFSGDFFRVFSDAAIGRKFEIVEEGNTVKFREIIE